MANGNEPKKFALWFKKEIKAGVDSYFPLIKEI